MSGRRVRPVSVLAAAVWLQLWAAGAANAQAWQLGHMVLAQAEAANADIEAKHTTMARALFDEGLRFVDAEQWAEAQDRFARVLTLRYSAVAAYNLGLAQARLGRGLVAAAALRKLLADPALDAKVRERASALLADVESHFAWLTLRVTGDCRGCMVYVDQEEWPWAAVGVSVPIDAGRYALRLRIADRIVAEERVELATAAHVEANLMVPEALQASLADTRAPGGSGPLSAPQTAPASSGIRTNVLESGWFWGAMGMIAAGAAAAIILETR